MPSLSRGGHAQPVFSFRDRTGDLLFEFHHVYRPIERLIDRQTIELDQLDQDLSYWLVTWSTLDQFGGEQPAGRWMTYAEARKSHGRRRLSFTQFSQLRADLGSLLQTNEIPRLRH